MLESGPPAEARVGLSALQSRQAFGVQSACKTDRPSYAFRPISHQCPTINHVVMIAMTKAHVALLDVTCFDAAQTATKPQTAATAIPAPIDIQPSNARFAARSSRHGIEEPDLI